MKLTRFASPLLLLSLLFLSFFACSKHDRPVVPYDIDADEVFKRLAPNEEDVPEGLTFGSENIPGVIFDYEMPTNDSNIYVYFDKITLLDVKPEINRDILDFIYSEMEDNDFLNKDFHLPENMYLNLLAKGASYIDAATQVLDTLNVEFKADVSTQDLTLSPFNMYFLVYPVYIDKDYVTYRLFATSYTGGAHGMQYSFLKTYDLKTGKCLSLEDIVKPEGMEEVREEVAAHFAYSYPIYENITTVNQYLDSLNAWLDNFNPEDTSGEITLKDFPLKDPAITEEGLTFLYAMYELTPGSDGCPLIVIPFRDIKGCLYPQFEK